MKKITKLFALAGLMLMTACSQAVPTVNHVHTDDLMESAYDYEDNNMGIKITRGATLGDSETVEVSKTYVQHGTMQVEGTDVKVMRFATALRGPVETITYQRGDVEGADSVEPQEVTTVYKSITADNSTYYYNGTDITTDSTYSEDYYWAVYSIRFLSGETYKYHNLNVTLTINGKVESSRTASLAEVMYGEHTHNYVSTKVDDDTHKGVCDACGTLGEVGNHTFDKEVENNTFLASPATCEVGATYYKSCECGAVGSEVFGGEQPLGHNETAAVDNETFTCSRCKRVRYRFDLRDTQIVSTGKTATKDGIGASWGIAVSIDFRFIASKAEKTSFYAEVSQDTREILFTDYYAMTLNGKVVSGTGKIAASATRSWTTYDLIKIGEFDVVEGLNILTINYTPQKTDKSLSNYNLVYNLLSLSVAGEGTYDWGRCAVCGNCRGTSCGDDHDHCSCYNFNAMDYRVIFNGKDKQWSEMCLGGTKNDPHDIIYYIHSDKDTTAEMYTNVSAITGSYSTVRYDATWTTTINGTTVATDTLHHCSSQGIKGLKNFFDYEYELVSQVELKAGVNKIVFAATGNEALNFRDLAFKGADATLNFAKYCVKCEKCVDADCTNKCDCGASTLSFGGNNENISLSGSFNLDTKKTQAIGQIGYVNGSTISFTINSSAATTGELFVLMSSDSSEYNLKDVYSLSVGTNTVTTESKTPIGVKWYEYEVVSFGTFDLTAGTNTFTITYLGNAENARYAYNLLTFSVIAQEGTLSW